MGILSMFKYGYYFPLTLICIIISSSIIWQVSGEIKTTPSCSPNDDVCEFYFTITNVITMIFYVGEKFLLPVRLDENNEMCARSCNNKVTLSVEDKVSISTADGRQKEVTLINHQLPGPSIVVYQGQQVIVHVTNNMANSPITIHWHGLEMKGLPFMDGVAGVSQCPINPGESFTYRFNASDTGDNWYHAHLGTLRSMGAHGPLVILPKPGQETNYIDFADDFILMVSDWFKEASDVVSHTLTYDTPQPAWSGPCSKTKRADGMKIGMVPFESGLINGKGRYYPDRTTPSKNVSLETFTIKLGLKYKFRMSCASMVYAWRVSIDGHPLHIISTDGVDVKETVVESIIINPGERFTFWIEASDSLSLGNYWIRAITLEESQNGKPILPGHTEAILHYDSYPLQEPQSNRVVCTDVRPCNIMNCPFYPYPNKEYTTHCIKLTDLKTVANQPTLMPTKDDDLEEIFLNFQLAKEDKKALSETNINGRVYLPPTSPPQVYLPDGMPGVSCDTTECSENMCHCTHVIDIPLNKTIQMVISIALDELDLDAVRTPHPFHIHGHNVEIIKMGYPIYNQTTGLCERQSPDISCQDPKCLRINWSDPTWSHGNLPGIVTQGAPQKDTFDIPAGGYIVVRFRSDNPGYWFIHCHTEMHNHMGMALIMKEGSAKDMPKTPEGMKTCGNFLYSEEDKPNLPNNLPKATTLIDDCNHMTKILKSTSIGFLISSAVLAILAVYQVYMISANSNSKEGKTAKFALFKIKT